MTENQKKSGIAFCVIMIIVIVYDFYYRNEVSKNMKECSRYTIGEIKSVYTSRWMTRIKYQFQARQIRVEHNTTVGRSESEDGWWIDKEKLKERRLLIQYYCKEPKSIHKIFWDIKVPDTLSYVPFEGWKEIPYDLGENK